MRCPQKKDEILKILVEEFERVQNALDDSRENNWSKEVQDRNYGRYVAMMDLLARVEIYED